MDKLLDALRETLAKLGLDDAAIDAALQEAIAKAEGAEGNPGEGDPADPASEVPPTEPGEPTPGEEEPGETPSVDPSAEEVPPEGDPQEVVPPTEPELPAEPAPEVPPFDPTALIEQVTALQGQLDEMTKANEGLVARIQSLEEGLKAAGVIDGSTPTTTEVGDPLPSAAPTSPTDDVFGGVLSELNGHKRF